MREGSFMPYCPDCGTQVRETQNICQNCGKSLNFSKQKTKAEEENSTFGYAVLGFVMPLVGLVLYLIWLEEKPKASRSAGVGALARVIFSIIGSVIAGIIIFLLMASGIIEFDSIFDFMNSLMQIN
jgi:predicted nucleic acid-binding Zn ribbon protein